MVCQWHTPTGIPGASTTRYSDNNLAIIIHEINNHALIMCDSWVNKDEDHISGV